MRVALASSEPLLQRVGRILKAHEAVETVGYWAESTRSASVYVCLIAGVDAELAASRGMMVVSPESHQLRGLQKASMESLAHVLAVLDGGEPTLVATARPGGRSGRTVVRYPAPVGRRMGTRGDDGVVRARSGALVSALVVELSTGSRFGVVDDPQFLDAACLAAGALACPRDISRTVKPADVAADYLEALQWAGVVVAGAVGAA